MKKFSNSLFFYPLVALFAMFSALFGLYVFSLDKARTTMIQQYMHNSKEDVSLLKSIIEELSFDKKDSLIQREVIRAATRKNVKHLLLLSKDGTVLYGNRFHFSGKSLEQILEPGMASHYKYEMEEKPDIHTHPYFDELIDATLPINYLYNPIDKSVDSGFLLMLYDISLPLKEKREELQTEFLQIYLGISFIIMILFYLYYRNFLTKLLYLEKISSQMHSSPKEKNPHKSNIFSLDKIVKRLIQTTKDLTIMSRVIHNSNDAILITDSQKNVISVNPAFENLTGYKSSELIGKKPETLIKSHMMSANFYENMWKSIQNEGRWNGEILDRRKDGSSYTAWQNIFSLHDPQTGELTNYVAMSKDISELMQKQKEIEYLAYYDGLTNLLNRSYFLNMLNNLIAQNNRHKHHFAIFYADLDDFKEINDTLGHAAGDEVLKHFAKLLKYKLRIEDIVSRLGGDEFAIISPDTTTPENALEIANKIIEISKTPVFINGKNITINISIGIALYPDDGENEQALLAAADLAMYKSKENGKNQATLFQDDMQKEANKRVHLREDLKNAILNNEFLLQYQPKVDANTKKISGFEALIRWKHPQRGLIPPYEFIPIAEESGLIIPMTQWIFKEVNDVCGRFKKLYKGTFSIAVNISAKHFQDQSLIEQIRFNISEKWIQEGCIELEVTESAVMGDIEMAKEQLNALHKLGVKVSLDDYGTGHSSLAYLKHLPIDTIKIDKSFIDGVPHDRQDCAITYSVIQLADMLGLSTIAEGVENEKQALYLASLGVDYIQGYFYYKPLLESDAIELLSHQSL
ncbi:EAL domain-containing protein [bacterium]|nr:EAL domain-containing protein [bacterium]MBU1989928.1 EAL domain-containing protein [bacterium]